MINKNINIINKFTSLETLHQIYSNHLFLIYISRYDSFGLTLAKGISMGHFIFCLDGQPWNEQLKHYPRKMYIKCERDGNHLSQKKYKANLDDLRNKLYDYENYINIVRKTDSSINTFINFSNYCILSNISNSLSRITNKKMSFDLQIKNEKIRNIIKNIDVSKIQIKKYEYLE